MTTDAQRDEALLVLLESLPRVRVSHEGPYTYEDRARDFIAIFGNDQGRRVLSQIQQFCDPAPLLGDADRHGTLAFKSGARWIFVQIMTCFTTRQPIIIEKPKGV